MGWDGDVYVYNLNFAIPSTVRRIFLSCYCCTRSGDGILRWDDDASGVVQVAVAVAETEVGLGGNEKRTWDADMWNDRRTNEQYSSPGSNSRIPFGSFSWVAIILTKWVAVEGYFLMRAECAKRESGWKGWLGISVSVYVGGGYLLLASAPRV